MNNKIKLFIGLIVAFSIIIISILSGLSILKDEAITNYLTISKLNAKAFSKELNQDITNIEQIIKNLSSLLNLSDENLDINQRLKEIQKNYPQIRSTNILKNDKIIYSSNRLNIGITINNTNFFPKPIFDDNILKISTPWIGRDFISGNDVYNYEDNINKDESFFIPISKRINTKKGDFDVVVNLNNDYFINRFLSNINSNDVTLELIRLDGVLILSSNNSKSVGKKIKTTKLLEKTIEKSEVSGIEIIDEIKYIVTYILTEDYPINLSVKLDYDKNLISWNKKQYNFFIITTIIVIISILVSLFFFFLYGKEREIEIKLKNSKIEEQEKFRLLFQDSHFLGAVLNAEGRVLDLNSTALNFLGKKLDELEGVYFWNLSCWDFDEGIKIKSFLKSKEAEKNINLEINALTIKKELAVIDFTLSTIHTNDDYNYIAIGQDITQRKRREKKLKQAYTVFNNTRDGIMITDKYSNILDVNHAFENITGYSKKEILNKNTRILKSNLHEIEFYENMWNDLQNNGYWEGEITNFNKNREYFIEWLTINSIYNENMEIVNYIGIFSDITEQKNKDQLIKEKEKLLYQQSKMAAMGEMLENIAHQWRQPLSVISTAATGMKIQKEFATLTKEEEFKTLDTINNSAQFLSETINDFRSYLNSDNVNEDFEMSEAIEYSLKLISSKIKNREINIIKNYEKEIIKGVKNEFVQVIMNLINNAKDALENSDLEEKLIFISSKSNESHVTLILKDNAGGVPENIIERIFEPYFTTKHQSQGTGIGLYMSEEIIRNHLDGTIIARNEEYIYNGKKYVGACFEITLPL